MTVHDPADVTAHEPRDLRHQPAFPDVAALLTGDGDPALADFWRVAVRGFGPRAHVRCRLSVTPFGIATYTTHESGGVELPSVARQPWRLSDTREALEVLETSEMIPPPNDRWRCLQCYGCACAGTCTFESAPIDFPLLAAVASLGRERWQAAEEPAEAINPGASIHWCSLGRASSAPPPQSEGEVEHRGGRRADAVRRLESLGVRLHGYDAHRVSLWVPPLSGILPNRVEEL